LILTGYITNLRSNLVLPVSGNEGSVITWSSDRPTVLSNEGVIINRPAKGSGNAKVTMTATLTKGGAVTTKSFEVYVAVDEGFGLSDVVLCFYRL
jgi:hypothetical protein